MSLGCGPVAFVIVSDIIPVYFSYKTWIGNRRRKYRLMGIEVPPPRGGPADFSDQSEFVSKSALNPGEETATEVGDDNDRNDEVSICLSEGSSQGIWKCSYYCAYIFNFVQCACFGFSVVHIQKHLKVSTSHNYLPWPHGRYCLVFFFSLYEFLLVLLSQSLQKPFILRPLFLSDTSKVKWQVHNLLVQLRDGQTVQM